MKGMQKFSAARYLLPPVLLACFSFLMGTFTTHATHTRGGELNRRQLKRSKRLLAVQILKLSQQFVCKHMGYSLFSNGSSGWAWKVTF